ncbi:YebO family protein [Erwinia sp. INIA-01]|uniref:YebO family protein n=1 Tax=Erwinia sp. INIA01 TaxID=2991500 RepID=UPI002223F74C|nr:YebO family protein [Erwinia sp. INIA01]MCW1876529.1 YebO family protein [Erwinia sp. INIA01]
MNEMVNDVQGLTSTALIMALVIIGLVVWFFVNRASVRANQQIHLLEALLEEQKRQNALLRKLTENAADNAQPEQAPEDDAEKDFIRMIPER